MKEFLLNILPRIKAYSKELDITENIIDKPWIWISEHGDNQKMVFRRGGILLMVNNGDVKTGTWEFIPALNSFLIDRTVDKLLMNHRFINESVMLLKRDGSPTNEILAFVNEHKIPSLDYQQYLSDLANSVPQASNALLTTEINLSDSSKHSFILLVPSTNSIVEVFHNQPCPNTITVLPQIGQKIYVHNGTLKDGFYTIPHEQYIKIPKDNRKDNMLYQVKDSVVTDQFILQPFRTYDKAKRHINVFYKRLGMLQESLVLYTDTWEKVVDGKYNCALMTYIVVKDGRVVDESMF